MKIGDNITVVIPYKNGEERKLKIRTKEAIIVGIYANHILTKYEYGCKESFRKNEIKIIDRKLVTYGYKD